MDGTERQSIQNFITTQIVKKKEHLEIGDEEDLIASGIIDSLGIMHLVGFIENHYGIRIRDEDLLPENFSTITAIASFIAKNR